SNSAAMAPQVVMDRIGFPLARHCGAAGQSGSSPPSKFVHCAIPYCLQSKVRPASSPRDNRGSITMKQMFRRGLQAAGLAAALLLPAYAAHAQGVSWPGPTVDNIKKRGVLSCGVDTGVPGFATQDNAG